MFRLLLIAFSLIPSLAPGLARAEWRAGAAKVVITPEKLMWMSGYGSRTKPAEGKLTDLWAKALVLEAENGQRLCLVSLDLVGIDRVLMRELKDRIEKQTGLKEHEVAFCCSHTHCGPAVRGNLIPMYKFGTDASQIELIDQYWNLLVTRVPAVVAEAVADLAPSELAWANGSAEFAVNRRNNKEPEVPKLRAEGKLVGPVDHSVPVLSVRRDRKLRAVAFGYACHATVLSFFEWSGDYPGFAMMALENEYPEAVALFWAGCGADQNPIPRREVKLAEDYGRQLATAVSNVLKQEMSPISGPAKATYGEIDLGFSKIPSREELEKLAAGPDDADGRRAKVLLEQWGHRSEWPVDFQYPYPVQTWTLGNGPRWALLGGEVVVDYALRLKSELGEGNTWIAGYSNDVMAYIPSERVLEEGGYEGATSMRYYTLPSPWAAGLENKIVGEVKRQLHAKE
jgi:neutral ceramidase